MPVRVSPQGSGSPWNLIHGERLSHPGVILISDLDDDPGDLENLASSTLAYRQQGIDIRIVALNPSPQDQDLFAKLLGQASHITQAHLPGDRTAVSRSPFPVGLALLAVVLAVTLALYEFFSTRLTWRPRREARATRRSARWRSCLRW